MKSICTFLGGEPALQAVLSSVASSTFCNADMFSHGNHLRIAIRFSYFRTNSDMCSPAKNHRDLHKACRLCYANLESLETILTRIHDYMLGDPIIQVVSGDNGGEWRLGMRIKPF